MSSLRSCFEPTCHICARRTPQSAESSSTTSGPDSVRIVSGRELVDSAITATQRHVQEAIAVFESGNSVAGGYRPLRRSRSRAGNKNDGCHVEQKNWSVVRRAVGYHRYDTPDELALLNQIYALLRLQTNFFAPQQRLVEKHRNGARVIKKYARAATPYQQVRADTRISKPAKAELAERYEQLNPAQTAGTCSPAGPAPDPRPGQAPTHPATNPAAIPAGIRW